MDWDWPADWDSLSDVESRLDEGDGYTKRPVEEAAVPLSITTSGRHPFNRRIHLEERKSPDNSVADNKVWALIENVIQELC